MGQTDCLGRMETYVYECLHLYNPKDHQHDSSYIPIDPGDHLEVDTPLDIPISGSMEEPQVRWLRMITGPYLHLHRFPG